MWQFKKIYLLCSQVTLISVLLKWKNERREKNWLCYPILPWLRPSHGASPYVIMWSDWWISQVINLTAISTRWVETSSLPEICQSTFVFTLSKGGSKVWKNKAPKLVSSCVHIENRKKCCTRTSRDTIVLYMSSIRLLG